MSQRYNTKRPRPPDTELRILQKFRHFAGEFSSKPQIQERERTYLGLHIFFSSCDISVNENTPKILLHLPPKIYCIFT